MFDEEPFFFHLIPDKEVCADCLYDPGLKEYLKHLVQPNQSKCSYCSSTGQTVQVDHLQSYILGFFPFANADAELPVAYLKPDSEGAIWHTSWDTLEKFLGGSVCDELYEDFLDNLVDARYSQADWALLTPTQQRVYQWKEFQEALSYEDGKFRLAIDTLREDRNPDEPCPSEFTQALAVFLNRADALSILPPGSKIHRVHWSHLEEDDLNFSRLTCPPSEYARENRFSPAGESMFYGAKDFDTACLEIRAEPGEKVTHAIFTTKRDLCLVDYTAVKHPRGRFDDEWRGNYHISDFLTGFLADIRKEVKGEEPSADYLPTQAICHFFKTEGAAEINWLNRGDPGLSPEYGHLNKVPALKLLKQTNKIDGFCYRSSKGTNRTCYVLFCDNEQSADLLDLATVALTTFQPCPSPSQVPPNDFR